MNTTQYVFIEGIVLLRRQSNWVKRYACISNSTFTYKDSKASKNVKQTINLQTAKILLGHDDKQVPYLYIQKNPFVPEAIRIHSSTDNFNAWIEAAQLGKLTEEQVLA